MSRVISQVKAPSGTDTFRCSLHGILKRTAAIQRHSSRRKKAFTKSPRKRFRATKAWDGQSQFPCRGINGRIPQRIYELRPARRLSAATGGRYYSAEDLRTLPEDIPISIKGPPDMEEKDLWDMPFLFLLLVGLISAEWILRKRKGLA